MSLSAPLPHKLGRLGVNSALEGKPPCVKTCWTISGVGGSRVEMKLNIKNGVRCIDLNTRRKGAQT